MILQASSLYIQYSLLFSTVDLDPIWLIVAAISLTLSTCVQQTWCKFSCPSSFCTPVHVICSMLQSCVPCVPRAFEHQRWLDPVLPQLDPSSADHAVLPVVDAQADSYKLPLAAPGLRSRRPLHMRLRQYSSMSKGKEVEVTSGKQLHPLYHQAPFPPIPTFLTEAQYQS